MGDTVSGLLDTLDADRELCKMTKEVPRTSVLRDEELSISDATLIARLRKADEYEPLGYDGWEAADRIEQLAVTNEALIAENKRLGQQCEGLMQAGMNNGQALILAEAKLAKAVEALETLRPVWAQGWSGESIAAQASATALAQLWQMLGASNQTEAVIALRTTLAEIKGESHE